MHNGAALSFPVELEKAFLAKIDYTVYRCVNGPVLANMRVCSGSEPEPFLSDKYLTGFDRLATETLYATEFWITVSAVTGGATGLFMCHSAKILRKLSVLATIFSIMQYVGDLCTTRGGAAW